LSGHLCLVAAAASFVGTHFLLSHPLRRPLIDRLGEKAFSGIYVIVAFLTLGLTIWVYNRLGRETQLWSPDEGSWALGSLLMWFGSILFVGSFRGNPALPRRPGQRITAIPQPNGVFAITRHPMMWGFALWAITHMIVVATPKAMIFDGAILFLALGGSVGQDRKKRKLMGEMWHEWTAATAFVPFTRGGGAPGWFAFIGGTLLFLLATWLHKPIAGVPAGLWRWIG
jgi:uncharacterized membrane protein